MTCLYCSRGHSPVPPPVNPLISGAPAPAVEAPAAVAPPNVPAVLGGAGAPVAGNVPGADTVGAGQNAAGKAGNYGRQGYT